MSKASTLERHSEEEQLSLVEAPTQQKGRTLRRPIARVIVVSAVLSIIGGVLIGYLAYQASHDPLARGRSADTARWQGQADAYLNAKDATAALERGRAAETARWQAQAAAYLTAERSERAALERGRAADAERWQAQADAWLSGRDGLEKTAGR
jgi:hypothetical protein